MFNNSLLHYQFQIIQQHHLHLHHHNQIQMIETIGSKLMIIEQEELLGTCDHRTGWEEKIEEEVEILIIIEIMRIIQTGDSMIHLSLEIVIKMKTFDSRMIFNNKYVLQYLNDITLNKTFLIQTYKLQPPSTSIQQNTVENFSQPPSNTNSSQNSSQACDEQDIAFMKQFEEWQTGFEKWREENKNHPDKIQYKKYEDQFLTVRDQLTAVKKKSFS